MVPEAGTVYIPHIHINKHGLLVVLGWLFCQTKVVELWSPDELKKEQSAVSMLLLSAHSVFSPLPAPNSLISLLSSAVLIQTQRSWSTGVSMHILRNLAMCCLGFL